LGRMRAGARRGQRTANGWCPPGAKDNSWKVPGGEPCAGCGAVLSNPLRGGCWPVNMGNARGPAHPAPARQPVLVARHSAPRSSPVNAPPLPASGATGPAAPPAVPPASAPAAAPGSPAGSRTCRNSCSGSMKSGSRPAGSSRPAATAAADSAGSSSGASNSPTRRTPPPAPPASTGGASAYATPPFRAGAAFRRAPPSVRPRGRQRPGRAAFRRPTGPSMRRRAPRAIALVGQTAPRSGPAVKPWRTRGWRAKAGQRHRRGREKLFAPG
jgi:hypothetical protein